MKILLNTGGLAETNSYLIVDEPTKIAAIVDAPGDTVAPHLDAAKQNGWDIQYLLLTHGHWDHLSDHKVVTDALPNTKLLMHKLEEPRLEHPGSMRFALPYTIEARKADGYLADGDTIQIGRLALTVMHTPGHAQGHLVFHCDEHKVLFTGDLIMAGAVGRYDFEDGDINLLKKALHRVMQFPDDTQILSGHGPGSTIGRERNGNPFIRRWKLF
ncbi:MAG: MBL fold metallo-hydrolase [Phycisphaerales bacterium]|nr:MBL fold metallo-hydrolase [Phycisphaerales bacterium]